jgi:hypothetical protein
MARRGELAGPVRFDTFAEWQSFVLRFTLPAAIPQQA